jgi:predicted lipid-binding transport protein (Tim44 family)
MPTWYTGLATDVQSYFSSANAQNTAACASSPAPNTSAGLSSGAKGGIAGGAIGGAAMIAGLAYLIYTKLIAPKAMAKSAPTPSEPDDSGKPWQDNSGGQWQHQDNNGQPWQNSSGQPDTVNEPPTNSNTGGPKMSQPAGWSGVTGDP